MSYRRRLSASAPGRAGIIGNPTDMYGGAVLSCSVGMRARVVIGEGDGLSFCADGRECHIAGRQDLRPRGDLFDVARATVDYMRLPPLACRVEYRSNIPVGSGLAGSTALLAALVQGLLAWQGRLVSHYRLAEIVRYVELNHLKIMGGYQDAYMASFGGLNYMDFRGKEFYREADAELFATVEPLGPFVSRLPFVLAFTGVRHSSNAIHKPLRERWLEGEAIVVEGYRRITELARTGKKALLTGDWALLGRLMNENHAIQRDLGGSGEVNERLIQAALRAGALGAKLAGAGDGGTIIALSLSEDSAPFESALREAGASATYCLDVQPGAIVEADDEV